MRAGSQKRILKSLLDISGFTNYVDNPELILSLIIEECMLITRAEWGAILTYDGHYDLDSFQITKNLSGSARADLCARLDGVIKDIVKSKGADSILNESLWQKRETKSAIKAALGDKTHNIALCLIKKKESLMGFALVINKKGGKVFTKNDMENLGIVCRETAIVLENISLFKSKLQNEKMAVIGQTMTGIAHYIKNILQGISSGSYVLNAGLKHENIASVNKAWTIVDKNMKRISDLTMDMLYYSKERKLDMERLETRRFIDDIIELVRPTLKERGIGFKASVGDLPNEITINEQGIHRSILNLIFNAADACGKSNSIINLEAFCDDLSRTLKIVVTDNGIGMSKDVCEKIFQPFFSKSKKGTGLGLAITQKVVAEHGGSIKVASKEGKGTRFELSIPIGRIT
ncbi:MAG: HAMP domain-containing sensor histidine kinase [Candidatus Omnitrophota bacterium]